MSLLARVTAPDQQRPLADVLRVPLGIDVWEVKPDHLILRGTEAQLDRLSQMGYAVEQVEDVAQHVSAFATAAVADQYHSAAGLAEEMRALAETRPDIVELIEVGRSIEGRPILCLRIGDRRGGVPKVLFMGCHHAREWVAVEVPFLLAKELVERADEAPITNWLSSGEVWVAPMVNPDGHEHSRTEQRLWRKNRRKNADGSFGVDPNRNYGYMWGTLDLPTSSHVPSDETYVGPRAFSEPETQAVRDLVGCGRFSGVITYHSYSQLILYPWGYTDRPIPDIGRREEMIGMAGEMQGLIQGVHGKVYVPQQSSELYPTAGDTTDWTYGTYGIPSFTVELRPRTFQEGGFILPPNQIVPTWEENRPAAFRFIERVFSASSA